MVCLLLDEAEKLYNLISHPDQWDELPQEMQSTMRSLAENTKIIKSQLFKTINGNDYLFVRPSERNSIIANCHWAIGHSGIKKTIEKIKQDYFWESINFDVTDYINSCIICQSDKKFSNTT